jgi:hypothetical protein
VWLFKQAEDAFLWYIGFVPKRIEIFDTPVIVEDAFKRMLKPSPLQGPKR